MPRRGQHDQSPGDRRKPFSDEGGPEGHHATTHDVDREEATRAKAVDETDDFAADLEPADVPGAPGHHGGHADESTSAADVKALRSLDALASLDSDDLAQLTVLTMGTRLEQGSVYLDLNDVQAGAFTAMGGQEAAAEHRYVAKRDTDHELWNRLVGQEH